MAAAWGHRQAPTAPLLPEWARDKCWRRDHRSSWLKAVVDYFRTTEITTHLASLNHIRQWVKMRDRHRNRKQNYISFLSPLETRLRSHPYTCIRPPYQQTSLSKSQFPLHAFISFPSMNTILKSFSIPAWHYWDHIVKTCSFCFHVIEERYRVSPQHMICSNPLLPARCYKKNQYLFYA